MGCGWVRGEQLLQVDAETGNRDTVKHSPKMDSRMYRNRSENQRRAQNMHQMARYVTTDRQESLDKEPELLEPQCCKKKNEMIAKLRQQVDELQQRMRSMSKHRQSESLLQEKKIPSKGSQVCCDRVLELQAENAQLKRNWRLAHDEARKFEEMARSKDEELIRMRDMIGSNLHCMPKDEGQWKVDELYLNVQERSTIQQTNIDSIVDTLKDHIQDSVESAEFAEGSQMYVACERHSEGYKNWELGYGIILCSVLQLCYGTCGAILTNKVAREAVRAYKDGRSFDPEVVAMLQNSLTEEDHAELEGVASCLVANGFSVQAQALQSNSRKYMAVYSLITAYLEITPAQDYIASAKRDIIADEVLKVATVHLCVEAFVDKILPLCWQLVTMYVPPILTCDPKVKVNGAHHDLSHMSSRADTVQSYLFPVVWYGGDVHRKARVLAENFK